MLGEQRLVIRARKPAALVADELGLDDEGPGERGRHELHCSSRSSGDRAAKRPPHSRMNDS